MTILDRIRSLANDRKVTLAELERNLNFSNGSLRKWETSTPSGDKIEKIADYFNVSTDYLLGRTDNPTIANKKEQFFFEGKEVDVEELASTAMRFNGKPLTEEDKKAIQNIIEIYLRKQ
ncbi:repressor protein [Streptococcus pneumoniae]|uniref:Repressor protein n=11 Tax=root TaxID=1 RepID=A0A1S5S8T2_9CAUD|nr:helix-turn-helix transcriptional regulator [Streptococcus pneumoniae]YP_010664675.1 transcriptional regulator [Streptococcus phage IPP54]YP_010664778.1 transcriptional regulator [Streptococcus phage IPP14]YP_010664877.1 transcriptional regulator [Streptococcus phage SpGS-1]YP_010664930.1 transcriptional regulator [Streptococcus phage IPP48]APD23794.1 repressor protein [Streptococcus phage IPP53]EDK67418.1 phage transcriptional regulator, Cro/CI family protein [Streptococcus pneumoniae SP18